MARWENVKQTVAKALGRIRGRPFLDATAEIAIESIPYVGGMLVKFYKATGAGNDEKTEQLTEILAKLEGFDADTFEQFRARADAISAELHAGGRSLHDLLLQTDDIRAGIARVREKTEDIHGLLLQVDEELEHLSDVSFAFDERVPADRLGFYLQLQRLLDRAGDAFASQLDLGGKLLRRIPFKSRRKGIDEKLREAFPTIEDEDDLTLFRELRRITDHMREVNVKTRRLLQANRCFLESDQAAPLRDLYEHLSWWIAKYELLRKDDAMCIVFVGVPPVMKGFPKDLDRAIAAQIASLKKECNLHLL